MADDAPPEGRSGPSLSTRVIEGFALILAFAVVSACIAAAVDAPPRGSAGAPARAEATSNPCDPMTDNGVCFTTFGVSGQGGALPTREEFLAGIGIGSHLIDEWHLDQRPPPTVTMPVIDGYNGLMIFQGCSGSGRLTVKVSIPTGWGVTQWVGCNGAIGPGAGFSAFDAGHGPGPFGPTTFEISVTEGVTDAEFFVLGET